MAEERLQKILARAGFGSRRSCEVLIEHGRALVNGQRVELGAKADPRTDRITVDGHPIKVEEELRYIALHKPRNVLSDEQPLDDRRTVRDLVAEVPGHLFSVGRLDFDSEGLILLTNDGDLANRLTHPRYGHEKEYRVLVADRPDEQQLTTWRRGVVMEDGTKTQPARVEIESNFGKGTWLRVILREGKKRQIREVGKLLGLPVVRILRVRIGELLLGNLKSGEWRNLTEEEVEALRKGTNPAQRSARSAAPGRAGAPGRPYRPGGSRPAGERRTTRKPDGGGETGTEPKRRSDRGPVGDRRERPPARPERGGKPGGETGRPQRRNPHPPSRRGTK